MNAIVCWLREWHKKSRLPHDLVLQNWRAHSSQHRKKAKSPSTFTCHLFNYSQQKLTRIYTANSHQFSMSHRGRDRNVPASRARDRRFEAHCRSPFSTFQIRSTKKGDTDIFLSPFHSSHVTGKQDWKATLEVARWPCWPFVAFMAFITFSPSWPMWHSPHLWPKWKHKRLTKSYCIYFRFSHGNKGRKETQFTSGFTRKKGWKVTLFSSCSFSPLSLLQNVL